MSSSISSTTSQQQFVQVQQTAAKTDATKGNATPNANVQPAQTTQAAQTQPAPTPTQTAKPAVASTGANIVTESKFRRNNDGTWGPGHTAVAPYNPLKPSANNSTNAQAPDSAGVGVNVQI